MCGCTQASCGELRGGLAVTAGQGREGGLGGGPVVLGGACRPWVVLSGCFMHRYCLGGVCTVKLSHLPPKWGGVRLDDLRPRNRRPGAQPLTPSTA